MKEIATEVAGYYGLTCEELMRKGRQNRNITIAKQMAALIIKELNPDITLENIGLFFNKKHCTMSYSIRRISDEMEVNKYRKQEYQDIKSKMSLYHVVNLENTKTP